jgi:two-component system chemotaxis response regulator CheB
MSIAAGSGFNRVRVLVAAPAKLSAAQLKRDLAVDPNVEVTTACTTSELFDGITLARPSVVLLDTKLAGSFTAQLVQGLVHQRQIAVVLRTDATENTTLLLDALEAGALAISTKPLSIGQTAELTPALICTLHAAATASIANLTARHDFAKVSTAPSSNIIALGAGIGALPVLNGILSQLPADVPGTIAVTDLPGYLTNAWIERIASRCQARVKCAANGDLIRTGQVLIAPGDLHAVVHRGNGGALSISLKNGPAVFHQKPSMEVLFNSLAESAGSSTTAAVLGGSGVDGVAGLLTLKKSGARTIAQLPQSCVCSDLPTRCQRGGCIDQLLPPNQIAENLLKQSNQSPLPQAA